MNTIILINVLADKMVLKFPSEGDRYLMVDEKWDDPPHFEYEQRDKIFPAE